MRVCSVLASDLSFFLGLVSQERANRDEVLVPDSRRKGLWFQRRNGSRWRLPRKLCATCTMPGQCR